MIEIPASARGDVFLGTDPVGGHLWGLHRGFEALGVSSDVYYLTATNKFGFPATFDLTHLAKQGRLTRGLEKASLLLRVMSRYEVFHFNNGKTMLGAGLDLGVLRAARKPVFFTLNGTAARSRAYCLEHYRYSQFGRDGKAFDDRPFDEGAVRRNLERVCAHARTVFCLNPDLCNTTPGGRFLPYAKYSMAGLSPREWRPLAGRKLRIAHAPTNRAVKGTDEFLAAVERLRNRLPPFEVVLIEGVDNAAALTLMGSCDILFDQLYVGWYGGVAVEAMAMGLPVICHLREGDLVHIGEEMRRDLPLLRVDAHSLDADLERALSDEAALAKASADSVRFVWKHHDPEKVARIVLGEYRKHARIGRSDLA